MRPSAVSGVSSKRSPDSVAHSGEAACQAADRACDRNRGRKQIRRARERQLAVPRVQEGGERGTEETAKKREATLSDGENSPWLTQIAGGTVLDDEIQAGAGQRPYEGPQKKRLDMLK